MIKGNWYKVDNHELRFSHKKNGLCYFDGYKGKFKPKQMFFIGWLNIENELQIIS